MIVRAGSDGVVRGSSQLAARDALEKCGLARVIWSTPVILFPPLIMGALARLPAVGRLFGRSRAARAATELVVLTGLLWAALPMAIAVFPQEARAAMAARPIMAAALASP